MRDVYDLKEAVRKAIQLASIATDWNLDEVEIDGQMVSTYELRDEFESVLAAHSSPHNPERME